MAQFLKIIHRPCWVQFHVYLLLLSNCTVSLHKSKHASTYKCEASWESWLTFQVWTPLTLTSCPVLRTHPLFPSVWPLPSVPPWNCSQLSDSENVLYYRHFCFLMWRKQPRQSVLFKMTSWCWLLLLPTIIHYRILVLEKWIILIIVLTVRTNFFKEALEWRTVLCYVRVMIQAALSLCPQLVPCSLSRLLLQTLTVPSSKLWFWTKHLLFCAVTTTSTPPETRSSLRFNISLQQKWCLINFWFRVQP